MYACDPLLRERAAAQWYHICFESPAHPGGHQISAFNHGWPLPVCIDNIPPDGLHFCISPNSGSSTLLCKMRCGVCYTPALPPPYCQLARWRRAEIQRQLSLGAFMGRSSAMHLLMPALNLEPIEWLLQYG